MLFLRLWARPSFLLGLNFHASGSLSVLDKQGWQCPWACPHHKPGLEIMSAPGEEEADAWAMWGLQGHTEQDEEGWGLLWLACGLVELTGQQGLALVTSS